MLGLYKGFSLVGTELENLSFFNMDEEVKLNQELARKSGRPAERSL